MQWYRQAMTRMVNKEIDFNSDSLKWTLHTNAYVPNADTHANVSDLTNELATGGGYTVGGITLTTPTQAYTAANSWTVQRANTTAYNVGDVVRPAAANGFLYLASVAGTSGSSVPTFPTVIGTTVVDGGVTWECIGRGIVVLDGDDPSWPLFTAGPCRILVLSDRQTGVAATSPLIGYLDFGVDKTGGGGAFTAQLHPQLGALSIAMP